LSEEEFREVNQHKLEKDSELFGRLKNSGMVIDKGNASKVIKDYRSLNQFLLQGPSLHIIVPTLRCNQECIYCHAKPLDEKNLDMDKKTAIKAMNFVFQTESPAVTIEFQGGEPLLAWDTVSFIVKEARSLNEKYEKKDLRITVVTNLTLMDEEKLDFLIKNRVSICASLDGPEKVHDANRKYLGGGPTYKDVIKRIEEIKGKYEKTEL